MKKSQFKEEFLLQGDRLRVTLDNNCQGGYKYFKAIKKMFLEKGYKSVVITGMGSSNYSPIVMSYYLNLNGFPTTVFEATDLAYYGIDIIRPDSLVIVVSKGGESEEVKDLIYRIKASHFILGVSDDINSTLSKNSNKLLRIYAGVEKAPTTKSFICTIGLLMAFSYYLTENDYVKSIEEIYKASYITDNLFTSLKDKILEAKDFLGEFNYINILGRGPSLAVALQSALVFKEEAKIAAEGMSSNAFEHGPDLLIDEKYRSILLSPEGLTSKFDNRLIEHILNKDGKVVVITNRDDIIKHKNAFVINIPNVSEYISTILQYVPLEMLIEELKPGGRSNYIDSQK